MPFAFYDRLSPARKRIYRKSDAILRVDIPDFPALVPLARAIAAPLEGGDRAALERACQALVEAFNARLATPPLKVKVLERRPSNDYGELHGLYEPRELDEYARGERAVITVWMRTARKEQLVKFRTFLRTLVHEFVHHLDYEHFKLAETFHTEGFYSRESALLKDLLEGD
ncbi:hypothetical protein DSM104443_01124 [Usitatibacter rugosus]|uniref:Uncharacterized protein n=1 Tax=Usitatibacter rugosus TaxID=2732067 RepID=A0A6M4GUR3_9PROT|nr:hypothetical protein [Usitatibacter rugosus]QJR10073.1 hypothetical protein DSM104443_01124 [Usitatibacter rugosus]